MAQHRPGHGGAVEIVAREVLLELPLCIVESSHRQVVWNAHRSFLEKCQRFTCHGLVGPNPCGAVSIPHGFDEELLYLCRRAWKFNDFVDLLMQHPGRLGDDLTRASLSACESAHVLDRCLHPDLNASRNPSSRFCDQG